MFNIFTYNVPKQAYSFRAKNCWQSLLGADFSVNIIIILYKSSRNILVSVNSMWKTHLNLCILFCVRYSVEILCLVYYWIKETACVGLPHLISLNAFYLMYLHFVICPYGRDWLYSWNHFFTPYILFTIDIEVNGI